MSSRLVSDAYDALGVARDADLATIRKAHRVLILKVHPDRSSDPNARDNFQRIQQAYEILADPLRRQRYDDSHKLGQLRQEIMRKSPEQTKFGRVDLTPRRVRPSKPEQDTSSM